MHANEWVDFDIVLFQGSIESDPAMKSVLHRPVYAFLPVASKASPLQCVIALESDDSPEIRIASLSHAHQQRLTS